MNERTMRRTYARTEPKAIQKTPNSYSDIAETQTAREAGFPSPLPASRRGGAAYRLLITVAVALAFASVALLVTPRVVELLERLAAR